VTPRSPASIGPIRNGPSRGQHDPGKANDALAAHRIADHREGFLADHFTRHEVVRLLEITRVYLPCGKEAFNFDRARVVLPGNRRDILFFGFFLVGGEIFIILLAQIFGHCRRAFAPGRFGKFYRAGRRALAARTLKVTVSTSRNWFSPTSQPRALLEESTASPVMESTGLCLKRCPVRRLTSRKESRSAAETAG
jgi:hypothetical protein